MKYIMIILILTLAGCSGQTPTKVDTVFVVGDSMCEDTNIVRGWPDILEELSGYKVTSKCIGGIALGEFDLLRAIGESPVDRGYAVLALGVNDIVQGASFLTVLHSYEDALIVLESSGFTPVCFTYPYLSSLIITDEINRLNDGIIALCESKNYKVIKSSEQLRDYIHFNNEGSHETAVNAWRLL